MGALNGRFESKADSPLYIPAEGLALTVAAALSLDGVDVTERGHQRRTPRDPPR